MYVVAPGVANATGDAQLDTTVGLCQGLSAMRCIHRDARAGRARTTGPTFLTERGTDSFQLLGSNAVVGTVLLERVR